MAARVSGRACLNVGLACNAQLGGAAWALDDLIYRRGSQGRSLSSDLKVTDVREKRRAVPGKADCLTLIGRTGIAVKPVDGTLMAMTLLPATTFACKATNRIFPSPCVAVQRATTVRDRCGKTSSSTTSPSGARWSLRWAISTLLPIGRTVCAPDHSGLHMVAMSRLPLSPQLSRFPYC